MRNTRGGHEHSIPPSQGFQTPYTQQSRYVEDLADEIAKRISGHSTHSLTEDEARWVRLAIEKEAQSIKLRQAIIEKTLGSLIWSALIGLGVIIFEYAKTHGWKQ